MVSQVQVGKHYDFLRYLLPTYTTLVGSLIANFPCKTVFQTSCGLGSTLSLPFDVSHWPLLLRLMRARSREVNKMTGHCFFLTMTAMLRLFSPLNSSLASCARLNWFFCSCHEFDCIIDRRCGRLFCPFRLSAPHLCQGIEVGCLRQDAD